MGVGRVGEVTRHLAGWQGGCGDVTLDARNAEVCRDPLLLDSGGLPGTISGPGEASYYIGMKGRAYSRLGRYLDPLLAWVKAERT